MLRSLLSLLKPLIIHFATLNKLANAEANVELLMQPMLTGTVSAFCVEGSNELLEVDRRQEGHVRI